MKKPKVLQLCYFTVQGTPMLAVGRQEEDRLRVLNLLEGEEAERLYRKLLGSAGKT